MTAIVYQTDKRTGITYAYESVSFWNKEKQQSRAKRKLIGRVNAQTNEIVPTRKKAIATAIVDITSARYYCGATYLFDEIAKKIGLTKNLQQCFPRLYRAKDGGGNHSPHNLIKPWTRIGLWNKVYTA